MRRLTAIAALLVLLLITVPPRACAMLSHGAEAQHDCCQHQEPAVECGGMAKSCCVMQAPADTTLYPVHAISQLVVPPTFIAVVYGNRSDTLRSASVAMPLPLRHSPLGLLIAAVTVLQI